MESSFVIKGGVILMIFCIVGPFFMVHCEDEQKRGSRLRFCEKFAQSVQAYNECVEGKK